MIRICLFDGRLVCKLSTYVCLCLSVCRCLLLSVCLYSYVSMCLCVYMCVKHCVCLSVCLLTVCLAVGLYVSLSLSQSVYIYLSACLRAFVYLDLPVSQSVCLSVVGRSVGIPQLSVNHGSHVACRQRRGGCWKWESVRLRTQEQQATHTSATGWADECWALRTEAESRGLSTYVLCLMSFWLCSNSYLPVWWHWDV